MQRRFPIDDVLLRSGDICDRSSREVVRNRAEIVIFLGRQISGEGGGATQISDRILYIYVTVEHVAKFGYDRPSDVGD